jgi:hypothetical protein
MNPLLNSPFDDLQQATEEQLREQYLDIQKFIDEHESEMTEEQFHASAHDYMWDDEQRRQRDIFQELQRRGLLSESELKTGYLAEVNDFDQVVYDAYNQSLGDNEE